MRENTDSRRVRSTGALVVTKGTSHGKFKGGSAETYIYGGELFYLWILFVSIIIKPGNSISRSYISQTDLNHAHI